MDFRLNLDKLSTPEDIQKLVSAISELAESLDALYTETAPNGNISDRIGRIAIYKNGSTYEQWQNINGGTTWQRIDYGIIDYFKTGDWIISSVTTARTGWTNKSATYSNKFMRINATPLTAGGADTHTHTTPNHTHATPNHTHTYSGTTTSGANEIDTCHDSHDDRANNNQHTHPYSGTTASEGSGTTASEGSGTTASGDNVPAYVQVCIFEKD